MTVTIISKRSEMDDVIEGMSDNKSAKIRRLASSGYKRAEIAKHLDVRYQFVYNVVAKAASKADRSGIAVHDHSSDTSHDILPRWAWVRVGRNGSVELPEQFQSVLTIREGDQVQLQIEDGAIRILTREAALDALKNDVRRFVPEDVSLVDALIADRREEVAREASSG